MNDRAGWRVEITRPARQDLKKLDPPVQRRIIGALEVLAVESPVGDVKRLVGRTPPQWRLRVGDWRVIFIREEAVRVVAVVRVLPRGRAYR